MAIHPRDAAHPRDTAIDLAKLPLLTSRRACILADCSRTVLQRTGPRPVGRRGRTFVYRTEDIIAWLSTSFDDVIGNENARPAPKRMMSGSTSNAALERLAAIRRGVER